VADKVARVAALAETIALEVGVDPKLARRAAELSKNDLQSRLVNEFPELQGIAGRYYAMADESLDALSYDQRTAIASAIDEAYMPRFAGDAIAPSKLGQVLAIAERLDTLAGGFAAGLRPTGNKDPFALRRNALGLARIILEGSVELDLLAALAKARDLVGPIVSGKESAIADVDELSEFILDRLRGYYADQSIPSQQFNAVAELKPASLLDFDRRLQAIGEFAKLPEAEALAAANKRIRNILRKVEGELPTAIDPALFAENAERDLAAAVESAIADTDTAIAQRDYVAVLGRLARLRPQVDAFFDHVMVNVDDAAVRNNRLALLKRLSDRLGSVAAIEHLSA
jgi:glycyl-tRNA synthetase beta chain